MKIKFDDEKLIGFVIEQIYLIEAKENYRKMVEQLHSDPSYYNNNVFQVLDEIIQNDTTLFKKTLKRGDKIYRARIIDPNDISDKSKGFTKKSGMWCGYNEANSRECPLTLGNSGRNNIPGQSYFYAAEDEATACMEVKPSIQSLISLGKFSIKRNLSILDFSSEVSFNKDENELYGMSLGAFFSELMMGFSTPVNSNKEYLVTQVISDHIRKLGIDGIAYKSYYTGKKNYTIFNCHPNNIKFIESRLLLNKYINCSFWDFSREKDIQPLRDFNMSYNSKLAKEIIASLKI